MQQPNSQTREYGTNLYIKNLHCDINDDELHEMFARFGTISSAKVMCNGMMSRGFGFVNYDNAASAEQAARLMNGKRYRTKELYVGPAQTKTERQAQLKQIFNTEKPFSNLYVKNLDKCIDDEWLNAEFSPFGTITSAKVMIDENGESRGFGFVNYEDPQSAKMGLQFMNGRKVSGRELYVAPAEKKEERVAMLKQKFGQHKPTTVQTPPLAVQVQHSPTLTPVYSLPYPTAAAAPLLGPMPLWSHACLCCNPGQFATTGISPHAGLPQLCTQAPGMRLQQQHEIERLQKMLRDDLEKANRRAEEAKRGAQQGSRSRVPVTLEWTQKPANFAVPLNQSQARKTFNYVTTPGQRRN